MSTTDTVESFECVICGEAKEIEEAATMQPPDVCLDCLDSIAEAAMYEQPLPGPSKRRTA